MPAPPLLLATHLLLGDAAPLAEECDRQRKAGGDLAVAAATCRQAFEAVDDGPEALDRRALLVATAHNLYKKALTSALPEAALPLACADVAMLRTFADQLASLPSEARPGDRADVAKALREVDPGLPCNAPVAETEQPPGPTPPASTPTTQRPQPTERQGQPTERADRRPPRPLRVAGGTALGLGLGIGAAMVGALIRGAALRGRVDAVRDEHKGTTIPPGKLAQFNDDTTRGHRADQLAIGLGITAAVLAGAGVALLVADRRGAPRRVALAPLVLPSAGVRFSLEF